MLRLLHYGLANIYLFVEHTYSTEVVVILHPNAVVIVNNTSRILTGNVTSSGSSVVAILVNGIMTWLLILILINIVELWQYFVNKL